MWTIIWYGVDISFFLLAAMIYAQLWMAYATSGPGRLLLPGDPPSQPEGGKTTPRKNAVARIVDDAEVHAASSTHISVPLPTGVSERWPGCLVVAIVATAAVLLAGEMLFLAADAGFDVYNTLCPLGGNSALAQCKEIRRNRMTEA